MNRDGAENNILVRLLANNSQFMEAMRAAQHATYDSVRAIKALNATAGGDLNKLLSGTIRRTVSFAANMARAVVGDAIQAIAFEENNQMALAALSEYRMKQEAIKNISTQRVQIGTKILTVEEQLAALDKRRMTAADQQGGATLDQINWLNDIKRLQIDITQYENNIARAREKLGDSTKKLTDTERQRLNLQIQDYQQKIEDITTYQIPKAQEKLAKSGYNPFQANENQVDWEAMAAQIMKGGDKVVGVFANQSKEITKDQITEIKKKADQEAKATMEVLSTIAIKSPFSRKEIVEAYGTLVRMGGLSFKQGEELMQQITDIQAVTGKGNKGIQAMSLAVGKVLATGRLNGDAVNQLVKTAGIPVWEILASSTGKTVAELQKMMRANKLTADIVMPALQGYMKEFAGKAAEEAGTFIGIINSFQDLKDTVLVDFFKPIGDSLKRPFVDLIDMLTGGPLRKAIQQAGIDLAEKLGKAIDFIYRAIGNFRAMGNIDGNPFSRIMVILEHAGREFNFDPTNLINFTKILEKIFNWVFIHQDALMETGKIIRDFFGGLILVTSIASVLGKIQMFITGFMASPIGLLSLAIGALYLAWKTNFLGIQDWLAANGPIILNFFKGLYEEIYLLARFLPNVDFNKFVDNLKEAKLISINLAVGLKEFASGLFNIQDIIFQLMNGADPLALFTKYDKAIKDIFDAIFNKFLNPRTIGKLANQVITAISDIFDPTKSGLIPAVWTALYTLGIFLNEAVNWVLNTIGQLFKTANIEKIWDAVAGVFLTILSGIVGFISGFFSEGRAGVQGIIDSIAFWFIKTLSMAVGAILNLAAMVIYDLVIGIIALIVSFISTGSKETAAEQRKAGNDFATKVWEQAIRDPFMNSFSGGRAAEIVNFVWEWLKHFAFRIVEGFQYAGRWIVEKAVEGLRAQFKNLWKTVTDFLFASQVESNSQGRTPEMAAAAEAQRDRLYNYISGGIDAAFDKGLENIKNHYDAYIKNAAKMLGTTTDWPTMPAPNTAFGINPQTGTVTTTTTLDKTVVTEDSRAIVEKIMDAVRGTRMAAQDALKDPSLANLTEVEVRWTIVPYAEKPKLEDVISKLQVAAFNTTKEYEAAGLTGFGPPYILPVRVAPKLLIIPETGADLTAPGAALEDWILQGFGGQSSLGWSGKVSEYWSAEMYNGLLNGTTGALAKFNLDNYEGKTPEQIMGYKEIGVPQGDAIAQGFVAGMEPATTAVQNFNLSVQAITDTTLPALSKNMDDWRLDMTTKIAPGIETVRLNVVDPLTKSFDGVTAAVERLNDKILVLAERLNGIKIPPQLEANSPTPFEMGLRGIYKATSALNRQRLPDLFATEPGMPGAERRQRTIGAGSEFGKATNVNVTVKVGDKEVASAVAATVAGEIQQMIYRDLLRG